MLYTCGMELCPPFMFYPGPVIFPGLNRVYFESGDGDGRQPAAMTGAGINTEYAPLRDKGIFPHNLVTEDNRYGAIIGVVLFPPLTGGLTCDSVLIKPLKNSRE